MQKSQRWKMLTKCLLYLVSTLPILLLVYIQVYMYIQWNATIMTSTGSTENVRYSSCSL